MNRSMTLIAGGGALIGFCIACCALFVYQLHLGPAVARKLHEMGTTSPPPLPPAQPPQPAQPPTQLAQPARPPA